MPKLTRKTVLGAKTETTQGTPVAITATDFILVEEVSLTPSFDLIERNFYRTSLDRIKSISGKRWVELTFKTELKGSGAAGTAYTPLGALIQACGFTEAISAGVSVTYAPTSAPASGSFFGPGKSCSIEVYMDSDKHIISGCIGSVKLSAEVGKIAMLEFTFKGVYAEPTDAAPGTQTYNTLQPPVVINSTVSVMGTALILNKFEVDVANEVTERLSVAATTGLMGFMITGRKPVGSIDPELDTVSAFNFWNKLSANTEASSSIVITGGAGNIITATLPKTQLTAIPYGDRNGIRTVEAGLQFNQNSGDDWLSLVFT